MRSKPFSLVKGRRLRVTRVDDCGRVVYGESSTGVSKGFISVGLTANVVETDEISVTNAAGERCIHEPAESSISGYASEIVFCEVDPAVFSLITGQEVYVNDAGEAIGISVNTKLEIKSAFALELWAGTANTDSCANPNAQGSYGYLLLPFLRGGVVGDITVENGAINFTITGANTRDGHAWGVGPYNVMMSGAEAAALPTPLDSNDALLAIVVDVAPPEPFAGTRPLLDPSGEPLTGLTAAVEGSTATFTPVPDDVTASVWYEFGDGTWDYLAPDAMGATTHTYPGPGTYEVRASANGEWATTTVTVA